jgi:type I restriction enzyme S subunit
MFRPYPDYRRTDLKWFEHLPDSWAILRTKQMFRLAIEKAPANNQMELLSVYTHIGVRPRKSLEQRGNKASTTDGYWVVKKGDIICNKLLAWMGAIGVSHYEGVTSPAYDVLRPVKACNTDYYHYLFRTKKYLQQFKLRSRGIMDMRLRLYFDQFGQIPIPVPPRPEQDQIVAYLRVQDAHIAHFIKAKRDLIKLLTEQKLRIIDHTITRGLDATATLRPSGVEWIGDVPQTWEVIQLRRVSRCLDGARIPLNATERGLRQGPYPYWGANKVIDHLDGWLFDEPLVLLGEDGAPFFDKTKDVAFAVSGKIWVNNHTHVLRPSSRITPHYLAHALNCVDYTGFIDGSTRDKLTQQSMKSIRIPLPPVSEQIDICHHIAAECAPLNAVIERTEREIELIREYRDRLIADVVTGQVDVRGWQPGPDDVVDDAALAALGDENEDVTEEDGDGED